MDVWVTDILVAFNTGLKALTGDSTGKRVSLLLFYFIANINESSLIDRVATSFSLQ